MSRGGVVRWLTGNCSTVFQALGHLRGGIECNSLTRHLNKASYRSDQELLRLVLRSGGCLSYFCGGGVHSCVVLVHVVLDVELVWPCFITFSLAMSCCLVLKYTHFIFRSFFVHCI